MMKLTPGLCVVKAVDRQGPSRRYNLSLPSVSMGEGRRHGKKIMSLLREARISVSFTCLLPWFLRVSHLFLPHTSTGALQGGRASSRAVGKGVRLVPHVSTITR